MRLIRLDCQHIAEHSPLLRGKLLLEAGRIQHRLPLLRRNAADSLEGAAHHTLAVSRHLVEGLRCSADVGLLLRTQAVKHLLALHCPLARLRRSIVERVHLIDDPLLLILRQTVEAGLAAQSVFPLLWRLVLVPVEPLRKMLLAGTVLRRNGTKLLLRD